MKPKFNTTWQSWSAERYQQLHDELQLLHQQGYSELEVVHHKLILIRKVTKDLRQDVINVGFANQEEEIWFLKTVLPKYRSLHYLYGEWQLVLSRQPVGSSRLVLQHYLAFHKQVDHFFHNHYPFYPYYQLGMSEMDGLYFTRNVNSEHTLYLPPADLAFSSEVSELFARFHAMETLRRWLLERIKEIGGFPALDTWQEPFTGRRLQWTGKAVNLAELVYGLYFTGQLNNGKATLSDITLLMEDLFQLNLTRINRRFYDIRNRKILSPTQFLDDMRKCIQDFVDQDLAYDPSKKKFA